MAPQKSPLTELRFPVGGLNRQAGFDQQPPYTTPYCLNVRPYDVVNLSSAHVHGGRQRGGARPGLVKTYAQRCGTGPIQMLGLAAVMGTNGVATNLLLAAAGGTLYHNSSGSMAAATGSLNATARQIRGTQLGTKYYIADYRAVNLLGTDGTIANTNRLSATSVADWTTMGIDTSNDYVWISGDKPEEGNIFPITSVSAGYLVFNGTITNQTGGVTWQIGRMPKVFDPSNPSAGLTNLAPTLPIPASYYATGTVTVVNGVATVTGGSWSGVPAVTSDNLLTLEIPNVSGIGTRQYLVASKDSDTQVTLNDQTDDADCSGVTYKLSWTSDFYGVPPLGCPLCCIYRGRLVLAGPGSIWYMSRVLNPQDWDYGYDPADPSRPVGGTSTTTGGIPSPITALMPHSDDYLIFGCERSLWLLNGDPAYGGSITALSREIGVLGPDAWCNLPDGSMVILSRDGLYQIPPGASSYPKPISRNLLPAELLDVDYVSNTISLSYDVADRGIHVSVTPASGAGTHYFVEWTTGSYWPVSLPNSMQPTAAILYSRDATVPAKVVFGGFDGYLRNFSTSATTDDGTAISSVVTYGPFRVGGPGYYGEILQIAADLDSNGQGVSWGIVQGDTAQAAVTAAVTAATAASATWKGTWSAGANHRQYPRASGAALVVMVSGTHGWAIEGLRIEGRRKGPIR